MLSSLTRGPRAALLCAMLLGAAICTACGASDAAPSITGVWPATIIPGQTRTLLISGQGFRDGATATLAGTIPLPGVVWVNDRFITAAIPSGLGLPGSRYSVVVVNPDQQQAVSPQPIVVGGAPAATATPAPTKAALPTATRERPAPTATPAPPTPAPTPTPTETPTPGPPIVIVVPPLQPPSPTASPPPSPVPTAAPSPTPAQAAPVTPSPRGQTGAAFAPVSPLRPIQPGLPGHRSPR